MNSINFTVPGEPKAKARPRFVSVAGTARAYSIQSDVEYEEYVRLCYKQQVGKAVTLDKVSLGIVINAYFAIPKSMTKKTMLAVTKNLVHPTKRPDWDNVGKIICDSLNGVAYHDDSQIVRATVQKLYGEEPRVEIQIYEL